LFYKCLHKTSENGHQEALDEIYDLEMTRGRIEKNHFSRFRRPLTIKSILNAYFCFNSVIYIDLLKQLFFDGKKTVSKLFLNAYFCVQRRESVVLLKQIFFYGPHLDFNVRQKNGEGGHFLHSCKNFVLKGYKKISV